MVFLGPNQMPDHLGLQIGDMPWQTFTCTVISVTTITLSMTARITSRKTTATARKSTATTVKSLLSARLSFLPCLQ